MAVFKCKMCGGTLDVNNETVAVCQYCGTKQTLPKLDDDRKANLYDRANHFRRNNEFDKAMGIYEQILDEDSTDAESYWSLVLCRYGIEYVEDPTTHKRIPTVNRAQFTSIFDDEDYKSALQYADGYQKEVYEQEATTINEIQKGILAISQKEEPFDVFICYKESDNNDRRTPDSVLATELYHELQREGFKVFFARITLEDKLGQEYEPYIFAALNSAKVMVVLGTKPEYFNAVWVKNEWSRYLALIKNGARKMLIPAYKDMHPYDLPEEFSHLQAQDMSKLGFMQDLIRGIKKIRGTVEGTTTVAKTTSASNNISAILDRAFIHLEIKEWNKANHLFEEALKINSRISDAYLGKSMASLRITKKELLLKKGRHLLKNKNFKLALRFADKSQKTVLENIVDKTQNDIKTKRVKNKKIFLRTTLVLSCLIAVVSLIYFVCIPGGRYIWYKNLISDGEVSKATSSYSKSSWFEYDTIAKELFYNKGTKFAKEKDYKNAQICFSAIKGYQDSDIFCNYCKAQEKLNQKKYDEVIEILTKLGEYKDSKELLSFSYYTRAQELLEKNDIKSYDYFIKCKDYRDSKKILETNKYFKILNKLQGTWYFPGMSEAEHIEKMRASDGYYEYNGEFYIVDEKYKNDEEFLKAKKSGKIKWKSFAGPISAETITISGSEIIEDETETLKFLKNKSIGYDNSFECIEIVFIDDTHFKLWNHVYTKQ